MIRTDQTQFDECIGLFSPVEIGGVKQKSIVWDLSRCCERLERRETSSKTTTVSPVLLQYTHLVQIAITAAQRRTPCTLFAQYLLAFL
jgi:hypothetical protein